MSPLIELMLLLCFMASRLRVQPKVQSTSQVLQQTSKNSVTVILTSKFVLEILPSNYFIFILSTLIVPLSRFSNEIAGRGGAVRANKETQTSFSHCSFNLNGGELGGAIYNRGNMEINNSTFVQNEAQMVSTKLDFGLECKKVFLICIVT
jgi:hypothetical protein